MDFLLLTVLAGISYQLHRMERRQMASEQEVLAKIQRLQDGVDNAQLKIGELVTAIREGSQTSFQNIANALDGVTTDLESTKYTAEPAEPPAEPI